VIALSGCAVPFYWQAIGGQLELLRKRTPIEKLVDDPEVDPALRSKLSSVAAIRKFAVEELELPDNRSYTTYVALDRSYVVWNVVAAKEFSVDPERWCFPFAGCVAYRGFFAREAADPVLSTMISGGEQYVASLLFHELAHQKLYIKGDSEFSEAFATVIEEFGTERWLMMHGAAADLERYRQRRRRGADFAALIAKQQARLREIYARDEAPEIKRAQKAEAFAELKADYVQLKARWGGNTDYDAWFAQSLNNASLAAVATYTRWVPVLRARLEERGLDGFYADTAALAKLGNDERAERLDAWQATAASAAG
jgi:predicted aminopeptidase